MRTVQSYRHTTVHWGKSQADTLRMLSKHGVRDVRFTMLDSRQIIICEFSYPTKLEGKEVLLGVRIQIKLPSQGRLADTERTKNQAHRALFYYLKTKFEALQFGLVEFVEEFLPHLTLIDKQGHSSTVFQMIGQKVKHGYITGQQSGQLLLPELKQ